MSYINPYKLKQYVVIDSEGNHIEYFRLKITAIKWVQHNQNEYYNKLEIIKNDKL